MILGHAPYTQCAFLSIQFTLVSKYMYECRHAFSRAILFWTVAEYLGGTYVPYVVSLHTQRCDRQCWQGVWKSQYTKERILIWVQCICSWHERDLRISTHIALPRPESTQFYTPPLVYSGITMYKEYETKQTPSVLLSTCTSSTNNLYVSPNHY